LDTKIVFYSFNLRGVMGFNRCDFYTSSYCLSTWTWM